MTRAVLRDFTVTLALGLMVAQTPPSLIDEDLAPTVLPSDTDLRVVLPETVLLETVLPEAALPTVVLDQTLAVPPPISGSLVADIE